MTAEARITKHSSNRDLQVVSPTQQGLRQEVQARSSELNGSRIPVREVLIAQPLGFCAGVVRAISALDEVVRANPDTSVYSYHVIVHNKKVQDYFEGRGVVFVEDVAEVPDGAPLMLSAHGSAPSVVEEAKAKTSTLVDAVCPLVTKTHREIERSRDEGRQVVYIGHARHDESEGAQGVAPENFHLVESTDDVAHLAKELGDTTDVALVMQTTLAQGEWQPIADAVQEAWPQAWTPPKTDICYATTNRQTAVTNMIDAGAQNVLVVTSPTSSNGKALVRVADRAGVASFLVEEPGGIPDAVRGSTVGITAAASTPWEQIFDVMAGLDPENGIRFVSGKGETERFGPPADLLRLRRRGQ